MSNDYHYDPTDPERRPQPLNYSTGRREPRNWADAFVKGCFIMVCVGFVIVGLFFGTCMMMR